MLPIAVIPVILTEGIKVYLSGLKLHIAQAKILNTIQSPLLSEIILMLTKSKYMEEKRQQLGHAHQKKDDEVFKFFKEAMKDIGSVFTMDAEKRNYTSERVQLVCVFTFVDVVASYWYEYLNKTGTQRERFVEWVERYCLTAENQEYSGTDFEHLTAGNFYAFRSSMVHYFGIAGLEGDYKLSIATNRIDDKLIEKWRQGFREHGTSVLIIKPKKLYNFVLEGAVVMLGEWKKIIDEAKSNEEKKGQHIEGIDRIYQKIQLEGAAKVSIPEQQGASLPFD